MSKLGYAGALLLAAALAGCGGDGAPTPESAQPKAGQEKTLYPGGSTPEQRMHDPEYLATLEKRAEGRKSLMVAVNEAQQRLAAAKAAQPADPAAVAEAEAKLKAVLDQVEAYRKESNKIVARQMRMAYGEDGKPVKNNLKEKKGN